MKIILLNAVTELNAQIDAATLIAIILFVGTCYAFYRYWNELDKKRFIDTESDEESHY